ncbi:MAG: type II toxin-antitoxin system RelE/ParE family toxin [Elusimicrobia bacterium]|nr:type II toxin-antitoxin system RelE/ParE family toxin [Elusimicrobiota bacterium]
MAYSIDVPPRVEHALDELDGSTYRRIRKVVDALGQDPRPPRCKKLGGSIYRIRVGDWRVIYAVFDDMRLVQLIRVVRRSERTYKGLPRA